MRLANSLQRQWQRMAPGDRRALTIVTLFLTLVFSYIGLIEPFFLRYDQAQAELADLIEKQRRYSRQVTMLPRRESRFAEYRSQLDGLNRRINIEVDNLEAAVSRSVSELTYYARLCEVVIDSIRPLEAQTSGEYIEIPFELETSGDFHGLRKFFYYIDTSSSLMAITRLNLSYEGDAKVKASIGLADVVRIRQDDSDDAAAPLARQNQLRFVVLQWIGYAPLLIAQQNGYLDSDLFSVDFVPVSDKVTIERLLLSGEVDGIGVTLPDLLSYWVKGMPLAVIQPMSSASGTEGIVVRADSDIQSVSDLRQRSIGVDDQGILPFVLFSALQQSGLSLEDIKVEALEAAQVARDIASGAVEVGLTREPYLSPLLASRQARMIYSSESLQGLILDMLAINPEIVKTKRPALQFMVNALFKAQRFIEVQPERTVEIIAEWAAQSPAVIRSELAKVKVFDAKAAQAFFDDRRLQELLEVFEAYFQSTRQPFPLITHDDIVDSSFIGRAVATTVPSVDNETENSGN